MAEVRASGSPPTILTLEEQEKMRTVCKVRLIGAHLGFRVFIYFRQLGREILDLAASHVKPGITTDEIDEIVHNATIERNSYPSPLNYRNYPKSTCTYVTDIS